jgi:hypothetical protein
LSVGGYEIEETAWAWRKMFDFRWHKRTTQSVTKYLDAVDLRKPTI